MLLLKDEKANNKLGLSNLSSTSALSSNLLFFSLTIIFVAEEVKYGSWSVLQHRKEGQRLVVRILPLKISYFPSSSSFFDLGMCDFLFVTDLLTKDYATDHKLTITTYTANGVVCLSTPYYVNFDINFFFACINCSIFDIVYVFLFFRESFFSKFYSLCYCGRYLFD